MLPLHGQGRSLSREERLKAAVASAQDAPALRDAFQELVAHYLQSGECERAVEWVDRARERRVVLEEPAYILEAARCMEEKAPDRARQLYQRVVAEFPLRKDGLGDSYADAARRRLIWLSGDRSWRVRTRGQLVSLLAGAVRGADFGSLQKHASKVNFWFGACESEFLSSDADEVLSFLEEVHTPRVRIGRAARRFPHRRGWYALESRGWRAPHDYIYLLLQAIPGGWEWIGAVYCDVPVRAGARQAG